MQEVRAQGPGGGAGAAADVEEEGELAGRAGVVGEDCADQGGGVAAAGGVVGTGGGGGVGAEGWVGEGLVFLGGWWVGHGGLVVVLGVSLYKLGSDVRGF